ncbi:MAG TPA: ABC transporter permease subunit [Candidatus Saccharimonadales bacterium]|nr:ABC transporter permease subunit [Candidatus Saccharimonadales bacterium]
MITPTWATGPGRPSLRAQRLLADGVGLILLASWALAARAEGPGTTGSDPGRILSLAGQLLFDPGYAKHTYSSFVRVLLAGVIAVGLGTALMIAARFLPLTRILIAHRLLPILNAVPTVSWAILAVVWLGVNDIAVVAVIAAILLPFTMVNVWAALLGLDEELYEMAKAFTRDRRRRLRLVVIPAILPAVVASARLSFGVGWKVGIVAELFGVTTGLGYLLSYARTVYDTELIYAVTGVLVALVVAVDGLAFTRLERLLTRHRADATFAPIPAR